VPEVNTPDTDGLLDRCTCGGRAQFVTIAKPRCVYVECMDCMADTAPEESKGLAMAVWNQTVRRKKVGKK
jgi:hypothetical protein